MNPDDLRLLETVGAEAEVAAGHVLIEHGQYGSGLYVILEGTVLIEAPEGTRELGAGAVIGERPLLITPGDRDDMIEMALELNAPGDRRITGIVLTGGFHPGDAKLADLRDAGLFTYLVQSDTYRTAQAVDEILVKTHPTDTEKIETIIKLVDRSLEIDDFLAHL